MAERSADWFAQAGRDLATARLLADNGRHDWSCFVAQQAAEKAVKAAHLRRNQEPWGHRLSRLLEELGDAPAELVEKGRVLDAYYVPTRYPNGHPEGAPFEQYGPLQSGEALRYAQEIHDFAAAHLA